MDRILNIIKKNIYIKNYKQNGNKEFNSLSYLVDNKYNISQSDCIKFGIAIEKILIDIILDYNKDIKNINTKTKKNKHEKDHLFINENENTIFYSELKSNLNLDTEKSKSTIAKCVTIVNELKEEFPDYQIKWCLLGLRYHEKKFIDNKIIYKYNDIKDNVYGVNEYFKMLNIDINYTEETYKEFINNIVNIMLKRN